MKIGVYKVTSPSNKVYIGQSKNIEARWEKYRFISNSKSQQYLNNSFKKYDIKNHKFEIVEECLIDDLSNREKYWITIYDSFNKGLNLTKGGENPPIQNKPQSLEHKLKIGLANKGKKHTEEAKQKIKEKRALQVFTSEQIKKISDSKKGKPSKLRGRLRPELAKKLKGKQSAISISCTFKNKDTGEIFTEPSILKMAITLGIPGYTLRKISLNLKTKINNYEYIK